jgi:hypothetical protein
MMRSEARKVPMSTRSTMRVARDDIQAEADFLPLHLKHRLIEMWIHSLIQQVYSQPIDVRIEQWLYDDYAALQPAQQRSLEAEVTTIRRALSQ